jgi:hypothetical protein
MKRDNSRPSAAMQSVSPTTTEAKIIDRLLTALIALPNPPLSRAVSFAEVAAYGRWCEVFDARIHISGRDESISLPRQVTLKRHLSALAWWYVDS